MPGRRVVVLGGGSSGEAFVAALRRHDDAAEITMVERELVGGECTYWACMPSKTLLRAPEIVSSARRAPGAAEALTGEIDASRVFWWRDQVVDSYDDKGHLEWLDELRVEFVRGDGRVAAPGRLDAGGESLEYDALVVATGSTPIIPPIPGLEEADVWTSREATATKEVPETLVVVGAGPVGCELAQFYARMGSRVVLVGAAEQMLPTMDAEAAAVVEQSLSEDGVELRLGSEVERVEEGTRVHLANGETVDAGRILVATGRRASVDGLGLEQLGVRISRRGVEVDERLRAAEGVWAIGDVTGIAMFTHMGKYQARVAAADVAGKEARADYRAVPATIFTDPQIATVGAISGDGLAVARYRLPSRLSTYERPRREGFLKLFADAQRRVVVGGVAVGPEAGEWLQQVTLAIRAEVPIDVLRDVIQPYPTFSEAVHFAARDLPL